MIATWMALLSDTEKVIVYLILWETAVASPAASATHWGTNTQ